MTDIESINLDLTGRWIDWSEPALAAITHDAERLEQRWQRVASANSLGEPPRVIPDAIAQFGELSSQIEFAASVHDTLSADGSTGMTLTETSVLNTLRVYEGDEQYRAFIDDLASQADSTGDADILDDWHRHVLTQPNHVQDAMALPTSYADWAAARRGARQHAVDEWVRLDQERLALASTSIPDIARAENAAELEFYANNLDNFRRNLPPEEQARYDEWVAEIRSDGNIDVVRDPAIPAGNASLLDLNLELAYRGFAAPTYGNRDLYHQTINDDQPLTLQFDTAAAANVELARYRPTTDNLLRSDFDYGTDGIIGDDGAVFVHEFVHLLQNGPAVPLDPHDGSPIDIIGEVFTQKEREDQLDAIFTDALAGPNTAGTLRNEIETRYGADLATVDWQRPDGSWNHEAYATLTTLYHQDPQLLKDLSPDAYALMVDTWGIDVLNP